MAIKIPIVTTFDNKGLKNAQSAIGKIGGGIRNIGKGLLVAGAATAAIGAIGVKFAKAAEEAAKVDARLASVTKSMGLFGNQAGVVTQRLEGVSQSLMKSTGIDDEKIKSTQALLMTFKEIAITAGETGGSFDRATKAALDLEAVGFGGAEGAAKQLGKALNDPIRGITALTRSGVTFTEAEREKITVLTESGRILEAQNMILSAVETQVGGAAEATKTATMVMQTAFGEFQEQIGAELLPLFNQIATTITETLGPLAQQLIPIFTSLFEVIAPLFEKLGPILVKVFGALGPLFETLISAILPLFDALMPLVDAIMLIVDALSPIIEGILPIFISLIEILAPVIAQLAKALLPIVEALLPPLLKLFEALIPIIELVADYITTYMIPGFEKMIDLYLPPIIFLIEGFTKGLKNLTAILEPVYQALKPVLDGLMWLAGVKPEDLDKTVRINVRAESNVRDNQLDSYLGFLGGRAAEAGGGIPGLTPTLTPKLTGGSGTAKPTGPTGLNALLAEANANGKKVTNAAIRQTKLGNAGLSKEVSAWIATSSKPAKAANQALNRISKNGSKAINRITNAYNKSAEGQRAASEAAAESARAAAEAAAELAAAQAAAAQAEADALAERERVYNSFLDSVKNTFAGIKNAILGAFDLTQLGGSTNAITRNMDKLLTRLKSFATNVSKLSGMGLNPALLQQVISAGPMAGARLAESLVMGGTGALAAINAGYNEFGVLSGQIAQTGTESLFNQGAQQTIYNINVDGGVGSGSTIGKAIVDAIKAYERTSGAVWQGA
jgi:phage-related protein